MAASASAGNLIHLPFGQFIPNCHRLTKKEESKRKNAAPFKNKRTIKAFAPHLLLKVPALRPWGYRLLQTKFLMGRQPTFMTQNKPGVVVHTKAHTTEVSGLATTASYLVAIINNVTSVPLNSSVQ